MSHNETMVLDRYRRRYRFKNEILGIKGSRMFTSTSGTRKSWFQMAFMQTNCF